MAIKNAYLDWEEKHDDQIYLHFVNKKIPDFWKSWNSKFKNKVVTNVQINGVTDNQSRANCFGNRFASVYVNSSDNLDAINEFNLSYAKFSKGNSFISPNSSFSVEIVDKCAKILKCDKAAGPDELMAEHILHSHPIIILHIICNLFKAIAPYNVVPDDFGLGIIIPLVKDTRKPSLEAGIRRYAISYIT